MYSDIFRGNKILYHCMKSIMALGFIGSACTLGEMHRDKLPSWIQSTSNDCPPTLLCALGEGTSYTEAEKSARESLAKIFETRVTGTAESHLSREFSLYHQEHRESFDEILQGVRILRRHRGEGRFFALASLHKKKSAQYFLRQAEYQNTNLLQHYQKSDMAQFLITYKLWQALEERYFFLTGKQLSPGIEHRKMLKKMHELQTFRIHKKILIAARTDDIKQHLIKHLTLQGYRTTDQKNSPYDIKLVPKMIVRQLHLKVPRFKKYEFSLQIKIYNSTEIQKDMLSLKQVQIGRSEMHAKELTMKNIFIGLEKKIDSLLSEE